MADLFRDSELSRADLENMVNLALLKVECDLHLAQFVWMVFNMESPGRPLKKSYHELRRRSRGLCCSHSKAQATVKTAKRLGFVTVTETWAGPGIQGANEYRLNVAGIRQILSLRQPVTGTVIKDPGTSLHYPGIATRYPGTSLDEANKEVSFSLLHSPKTSDVSESSSAVVAAVIDAREFSFEEEAEIGRLANELRSLGLVTLESADRETVLKTATLAQDRRLSEQVWGNLKEAMRERPRSVAPWKHFWGVMRNQCRELLDQSFERLLATTDFPRELLVLPSEREQPAAALNPEP